MEEEADASDEDLLKAVEAIGEEKEEKDVEDTPEILHEWSS